VALVTQHPALPPSASHGTHPTHAVGGAGGVPRVLPVTRHVLHPEGGEEEGGWWEGGQVQVQGQMHTQLNATDTQQTARTHV
jgi:hypothetical protein